jgi:hypothetical protein
MSSLKPFLDLAIRAGRIGRARALVVLEDGSILVSGHSEKAGEFPCDRLVISAEEDFTVSPGDTLLVWLSSPEDDRGVVLGRIGPGSGSKPKTTGVIDELVIEARKNLTLKCGDTLITLREDGKILIKGKDVVSHARRMNRIKGGAVSIN